MPWRPQLGQDMFPLQAVASYNVHAVTTHEGTSPSGLSDSLAPAQLTLHVQRSTQQSLSHWLKYGL